MLMGHQLQPSLLKQSSMCFITWNTDIHNSSFFRLSRQSMTYELAAWTLAVRNTES